MAFVRRRYYIWLLKAYVKQWKKTIFSSIILGGIVFFLIFAFVNFYLRPLVEKKVQKVGYAGTYNLQTLPEPVLNDLSYGLTKRDENGNIVPGAASRWAIRKNGREYIFFLEREQYFHNGDELTSDKIQYNFQDVEERDLDKYTISFTLKNPYSPFLTTVTKPIFLENFIGLGEHEFKDAELNGGFVKSLTIQDKDNPSVKKNIFFYPTQDALKTAFALGEIDRADGVRNPELLNTKFSDWESVQMKKQTDYNELITLFYNNADGELSNKKLRQALDYAIPSNIPGGERAYSPIPPTSKYFSKGPNYGISDTEIAKELLGSANAELKTPIEISVTEEYVPVARIIQKEWEKIGVKSELKLITELPNTFQVLIYPIQLPKDPDQYTLWHSAQPNNISRYRNLRIDKLLEDGRVVTDENERLSLYAEFQKYLIDDVPASFLYFPTEYTLSR